jgi:hypothetical protein
VILVGRGISDDRQVCSRCKARRTGGKDCRPCWVIHRGQANIKCLHCRTQRVGCSLTWKNWKISKWPTVRETPAGKARRDEESSNRRKARANSEDTVATRPIRKSKPPQRFAVTSTVPSVTVSPANPQRTSSTATGSLKAVGSNRQAPRGVIGTNVVQPSELEGSWRRPTGRVEQIFVEDLDVWTELLRDEDPSFLRLKTAIMELKAIQDREVGVGQAMVTLLKDRNQFISAIITGLEETAGHLEMGIVVTEDENEAEVRVVRDKVGGGKR